jgi:spore maturation protein SpmA
MLNGFFLLMVVGSVVCGAATGKLTEVAQSTFASAGSAVTLAVGLIGVMTLWLGLMRVLREAGMLQVLARGLQPLMTRLFPAIPPDHPAMSMMILNFTANMLGLGNAATPFGLKAMMELETLSEDKTKVSDSMALFLAMNTAGLSLFPTGIVAFRASLGSKAPAAIFLTTLISTSMATLTAIVGCKLLARLPAFAQPSALVGALPRGVADSDAEAAGSAEALSVDDTATEVLGQGAPRRAASLGQKAFAWLLLGACVVALAYALVQQVSLEGSWMAALKTAVSHWMVLLLIVSFVLIGAVRQVDVYEAIVEGGKEGFVVARRIIPFMVAILVAVGMLQASGGVALLVRLLDPLTTLIGLPGAALPMALLRPLSGSGSLALAVQIMREYGPDSLVGYIVSTINGSTETTFYLLAVYLGVVRAKDTRYTLIPCILADLAGMLTAVWTCRLML